MSSEVVTSAEIADWSREQVGWFAWSPSRRLLRAIRSYQHWRGRWGPIGAIIARVAVLRHRFWSIVCAADIPVSSDLGGGMLLPHPTGIVVHPRAKIGPNCLLFQNVTIGAGGPIDGLPTIGGHVDIGCGARVLGGVKIGDHAKIGANAVVLCDVPAGTTAVGIPARIIRRNLAPTETKGPIEWRFGDRVVRIPDPKPWHGSAA